jgi:hypothetical protein
MRSRQLLGIALLSFVCGPVVMATPRHTVKRGTVILIGTQFATSVRVQTASLSWQTYDPIGPAQRGMATAFRCDADVVANDSSVALSCKVPLNVADGTYYLTAISIRTSDSERMYSWIRDLPADIEVQIRGGEEMIMPHIRSVGSSNPYSKGDDQ